MDKVAIKKEFEEFHQELLRLGSDKWSKAQIEEYGREFAKILLDEVQKEIDRETLNKLADVVKKDAKDA